MDSIPWRIIRSISFWRFDIVAAAAAPIGLAESRRQCAPREDGVKVTLALRESGVEFFQSEAAKHKTNYQRMIRRLLDSYVEAQGNIKAPEQRFKLDSCEPIRRNWYWNALIIKTKLQQSAMYAIPVLRIIR